MRRLREAKYHNELVIVCEGSTTEYNYFDEIRNLKEEGRFPSSPYTYIHIIPGDSDYVVETSRKKRTLYGSKDDCRYFEKGEQSKEEYDKYKSQPVRYVREAELFLKDSESSFDEAWAVYDWDVKPDKPQEKKHKDVMPLLERNAHKLNIAFSSYSFEEWFLMHFEKNDKVFICSDCSDEKDKSYMCGTHKANYSGHDCHGTMCIAGLLREKNYIRYYTKEDRNLFTQYTFKNGAFCQKALYNAAWLRSRSKKFCEDPYTNVDELVCRMVGIKQRVIWVKLGDAFPWGGSDITISLESGKLRIENVGSKSCLLRYSNISVTDNPMQEGESINIASAETLYAKTKKDIHYSLQGKYIRMTDGNNIIIVEANV